MADFWTYWRVRAKARKKQINQNIKVLKKYKTLLYVGAHADRIEMVDLFHDWGYEIDCLEIWGPNVEGLIELNKEHKIFRNIIHADIMQLGLELDYGPYDVVMFWHGPEHIKKEFLPQLIINLEALATHYVIMAAPIGRYEQGPVDGNKYEIHETFLHPHDFDEYGYKADLLRKKKPRGSNMVLWKKMKK